MPLSVNWSAAFKDPAAFAALLAEDVVLEASAIREPAVGRKAVQAIMTAGSRLYRKIVFRNPATTGATTYSEWRAVSVDGATVYEGVTVLTHDSAGAVKRVAIHHRPLGALLRFSAEMAESLRGVLPVEVFYTDAPAHQCPREPSNPRSGH